MYIPPACNSYEMIVLYMLTTPWVIRDESSAHVACGLPFDSCGMDHECVFPTSD